MPEFNFYINDKERIELIEFIISKKTKIVPDIEYQTEQYKIITSLDDFISGLNDGEHKYFLINESFSLEPIINSKNRFSREPLYTIYQRKGGPYIDLSFYQGYADDAAIPYKRSVIDHYPHFIHYNSDEEFKAPEDLKAYYKEVVKFIKGKCNSINKNGRTYWISKEVLKDIWER